MRRTLRDDTRLECPQRENRKPDRTAREREHERPDRHVRELRRQRSPQRLTHVDHRIEEYEHLEPENRCEHRPRVVDASEEREREHDDGEEERDLTWVEHRPDEETHRGCEERGEDEREGEQRRVVDVDLRGLSVRVHEVDNRKDHAGSHERLNRADEDLLEADDPDRDRREHSVLDLPADAELLHERQRDSLDPLEVDRDRDEAGHEDGGERDAGCRAVEALADLREDVGEDEDEQERLHDRPDQELAEVAAKDADVAGEQGAECLQPGAHSRYSRPVRLRKTVSSLGGRLHVAATGRPSSAAASTSRTRAPSERAACTRTSELSRSTSTERTASSRSARSASGAGSPSTVTVISVSAPCLRFSSAGVSTASALPRSMIAMRSQRTSASSM